MLSGFLLICLYLAYDFFSQKEYEYTMEGTHFSIDMITGKRHRRQMHELDLNKLEVVAPHWHDKVAKYRKKVEQSTFQSMITHRMMMISRTTR